MKFLILAFILSVAGNKLKFMFLYNIWTFDLIILFDF